MASRHVSDCQLRAWVLRKVPRDEIARRCGVTTSQISRRIQALWFVTAMQGMDHNEFDPDEAAIRALCDEIQQGWSDQVRETRRVGRQAAWTPAVVHVSDLARQSN